MVRAKINPQRRAIYNEIARRIVNEDRLARKRGASQNTIGKIERALITAFLEGRDRGMQPDREVETEEPTWLQIPPRSRDTLCSMTFRFSARFGHTRNTPDRIERFEQNGKWRWRTVDAEGRRAEHSLADGSVNPLIRLELLKPTIEDENLYVLTERALHLCQDYWERSDKDDPTLPIISLR